MIEVHIPRDQITKLNESHVHLGQYVLRKLREKGVPVEGVLFPTGVESGTLEIEGDDLASDDVIWRWKP